MAKVGGSLFDWEEMPSRLLSWLERDHHSTFVLVAGGGTMANAIRDHDRRFRLAESDAHWLAIRAMAVQTHLLAALAQLPVLPKITALPDPMRDHPETTIRAYCLDLVADLIHDNGQTLPIGWHVTSDSIAAWAAHRLYATRLTLFKSIGGSAPLTINNVLDNGWVDSYFPYISQTLNVEWINLRTGEAAGLLRE